MSDRRPSSGGAACLAQGVEVDLLLWFLSSGGQSESVACSVPHRDGGSIGQCRRRHIRGVEEEFGSPLSRMWRRIEEDASVDGGVSEARTTGAACSDNDGNSSGMKAHVQKAVGNASATALCRAWKKCVVAVEMSAPTEVKIPRGPLPDWERIKDVVLSMGSSAFQSAESTV